MNLVGFRTVLVAIIGGPVAAWSVKYLGAQLDPATQTWIVTAIMTGLMVLMRLVTKTPIATSASSTSSTSSTPPAAAALLPLLLLLPLFAGCAAMPVTNTVADAAQLNTTAITTAVSLANSGAINSSELSKVLGVTNAVEAALVLAEQANNAGNATSAQATLTAVMTTLGQVTACLAPGRTTNVVDACIAGVTAP